MKARSTPLVVLAALIGCSASDDSPPVVTLGPASGAASTGEAPRPEGDLGLSEPPEESPFTGCHPPWSGLCKPGFSRECYEGPEGTEGVGSCAAGKQYCNEHGTAFGECLLQTLPRPDDCTNPTEWICDGQPAACGVADRSEILWAPSTGYTVQAIAPAGGVALVRAYTWGKSDGKGALVIERDVEGTLEWSTTFELVGFEHWQSVVGSLVVDAAGSIVITATFEHSPFSPTNEAQAVVFKLNAAGALLWVNGYWAKSLGGGYSPHVTMAGVAIGPDNAIRVTGSFNGEFDSGAGLLSNASVQDGFLLALDATGKPTWARQLDVAQSAFLSAVAVDASGTSYVGGSAGDAPLRACDHRDLVLASFDSDGDLRWLRSFWGELSTPTASSIVVAPSGHLYVSGRIDTMMGNAFDLGGEPLEGLGFIARFDDSGEPVWSRSTNDVPHGPAIGGHLAFDPNGHLMWANQDGYSVRIRTYDEDAHLLWHRFIPVDSPAGPQGEGYTSFPGWGLHAFAVLPDGRFALGGSFAGAIDFGDGAIVPQSLWAGYYAVLAP